MNGPHPALLQSDDPDQAVPPVQIRLLHVPDCPLVDRVRATLRRSLSSTTVRVTVEEVEGPYPSPTLLVGGVDVTGRTPAAGPSCRLDLPTEEQILTALAAASIPEQAR